jgi:hypothetical protein
MDASSIYFVYLFYGIIPYMKANYSTTGNERCYVLLFVLYNIFLAEVYMLQGIGTSGHCGIMDLR